MRSNIIEFNQDYKRKSSKLNKKIEEIIKKVENTFGLEKCADTLKNYAEYVKLKKTGGLDYGSYNLMLVNKSEYKRTGPLIDTIRDILKLEGIIKTDYKFINKDELKDELKDKNKEQKKTKNKKEEIKEELIIIDSKIVEDDLARLKKEILNYINKYSNKVFIFVDNDSDRFFRNQGEANIAFSDYFTWSIEIEKITQEEKAKYIKDFLELKEVKFKDCDTFIENLSKEAFWILTNEIKKVILQYKTNNINILTDEILKEKLKNKYVEKIKSKKNNKSAIKELNSLIGMEEVKMQVEQIINFLKVNKERKNMPALHMVFTGNPGTGKTTVARVIGKFFGEMKILSDKEKFVEIHGRDLIAKFVGWTAGQTKEKVKEAEGGVLFIDEAYSLNSDRRGCFEDEAIATLIKEMEDKRDKVCIIMAGYEKEMADLLMRNPGFESRIPFKIHFPDYTEDELYEIFAKMAKNERYKIGKNIKKPLAVIFKITAMIIEIDIDDPGT